jgi:signal transduction histidine kinase
VVWRADKLGRFTYVSELAESVLGVPARALGTHADLRFHGVQPEDRAGIEEALAEAIAARSPAITQAYRFRRGPRGEGELVELEERIGLSYDAGGRLLGSSGFIFDRAALDVESKLVGGDPTRGRAEFLDLLSHELRTPLFPIIALSDLILRVEPEGFDAEEVRGHVRLIHTAGKQMLQLVSDMLELSRIDAGRMRIDLGPLALQHFSNSIGEKHQERARAAGSELEARVGATLSAAYYTDRTALGRIGSALIEFAIEEAPRSRIRLEVEGGESALRLLVRSDGLHLGAPADAAQLFEPFWERKGGLRQRGKTTGLGLALAKRLCRAYGGKAGVEPWRDGGTALAAELPAAPAGVGEPGRGRSCGVLIASADLARVFGAALNALSLGADVQLVAVAAELPELLGRGGLDALWIDPRLPGAGALGAALARARENGLLLVALGSPGLGFPRMLPLPAERAQVAELLASVRGGVPAHASP